MSLNIRLLIVSLAFSLVASPATYAGKVLTALAGDLVVIEGKSVTPATVQSSSNTHVAFYFSAEWCPPCRKFTPGLVTWYEEIKQKYPGFELIFVSSDKSPADMEKYMEGYKMSFPAIIHTKIEQHMDLVKATGNGIPNMTFMDADGNVLSTAYADGNYRGPGAVLKDIETVLAASANAPASSASNTVGQGAFDIFNDKR